MTEQFNENLTKEQMGKMLGGLADYMAKTFPDWNDYSQAVQVFLEHGQFKQQLATVNAERDEALRLLDRAGVDGSGASMERDAALAEKKELLGVLWQLLDDMSTGGHCVCPAAKQEALKAYNKISPEPHEGYQ